MSCELHLGDCLNVLARMPSHSVAAIVTDPPYGLSFMGKGWDYQDQALRSGSNACVS